MLLLLAPAGVLAVVRSWQNEYVQPFTGMVPISTGEHLVLRLPLAAAALMPPRMCSLSCGQALTSCACPFFAGEVAEDLARYLVDSEQTQSALGLGVSIGKDLRWATAVLSWRTS